jgi:hypothetical protein
MSYTRFGRDGKDRRKDDNRAQDGKTSYSIGHDQLYPVGGDFDSDSDQVELSGITNRLYLENEDIYHIT